MTGKTGNGYLVKAGKHYFFLMYYVNEIDIWYEPWRNKYESDDETIKAYKRNGRIYKEEGPHGRAEKIRDALPRLRKHSRLPIGMRKALRGIQP